MKAIILAGGYAKRLWPLTKHIPKALLPIVGKPIIDFIIEKIFEVNKNEIDGIIVSTNLCFQNHFVYWRRCFSQRTKINLKIVTEPTTTEEGKFGAIGALAYLVKEEKLASDDLLVIAGDNLFEFSLVDLVDFFKHRKQPVTAFRDLDTYDNVRGKYGVGILDENKKVTDFQEKPKEPLSTLASTGCYIFPSFSVRKINDYLEQGNNPDATGYFLNWLCKQTGVDLYGFVFKEQWCDIGSFESYDLINQDYKGKVKV